MHYIQNHNGSGSNLIITRGEGVPDEAMEHIQKTGDVFAALDMMRPDMKD